MRKKSRTTSRGLEGENLQCKRLKAALRITFLCRHHGEAHESMGLDAGPIVDVPNLLAQSVLEECQARENI